MVTQISATVSTAYGNVTDSTKIGILSDQQLEVFHIINFVSLCGVISFLGITANIINIVIFFKQGFTNTVNISFFGLAISDLCCLLTLLWVGLCLNPLFTEVPWIPLEFQYLTGSWPHITCSRITSYITVFITAERCMCIIAPIKVKHMLTPMRTAIVVCLIYLLNLVPLVPEYATSYFEWKYFPGLNKTLLSITYTNNRPRVVGLVFFLSSIIGMTSFVAVIVFTIILVIKLKKTSEWRKEATSGSDHHEIISNRDKKTMKMIVVIASVLIVCYTPGIIISMTTFVVPEFDLGKRYVNICAAMWSFGFMFQAVNSSVNIIMYYSMSSIYRHSFYDLFCKYKNKKDLMCIRH